MEGCGLIKFNNNNNWSKVRWMCNGKEKDELFSKQEIAASIKAFNNRENTSIPATIAYKVMGFDARTDFLPSVSNANIGWNCIFLAKDLKHALKQCDQFWEHAQGNLKELVVRTIMSSPHASRGDATDTDFIRHWIEDRRHNPRALFGFANGDFVRDISTSLGISEKIGFKPSIAIKSSLPFHFAVHDGKPIFG